VFRRRFSPSIFHMTSEVFNPNPTIVATAGPSVRRRAAQARHSLWLSDDDDDSTTYDSDDKPEPIDADEIFGGDPVSYLSLPYFIRHKAENFPSQRSDSFDQRPGAPLHDVRAIGRRFCTSNHGSSKPRTYRIHPDCTPLWHVHPYRVVHPRPPASRIANSLQGRYPRQTRFTPE